VRGRARVSDRMTRGPIAIDCRASVAEAREAMEAIGARHLPVTDHGRLVGIASARDLDRLQLRKPGIEAEVLTVAEAMTPDPLITSPATPLSWLVTRMAEEDLDATVVMDGDLIVGIFTTTDAMRLLAELIAGNG
jgi:acetoin utilization protein AcuB